MDRIGQRQVLLEPRKFAIQTAVDPMMFELDEVTALGHARRDLMARLSTHIAAQRVADDEYRGTVQVPASPWDHWKALHRATPVLGAFVRRLRPPATTTETVTVRVDRFLLYPDIALNGLGRSLVYEHVDTDQLHALWPRDASPQAGAGSGA